MKQLSRIELNLQNPIPDDWERYYPFKVEVSEDKTMIRTLRFPLVLPLAKHLSKTYGWRLLSFPYEKDYRRISWAFWTLEHTWIAPELTPNQTGKRAYAIEEQVFLMIGAWWKSLDKRNGLYTAALENLELEPRIHNSLRRAGLESLGLMLDVAQGQFDICDVMGIGGYSAKAIWEQFDRRMRELEIDKEPWFYPQVQASKNELKQKRSIKIWVKNPKRRKVIG